MARQRRRDRVSASAVLIVLSYLACALPAALTISWSATSAAAPAANAPARTNPQSQLNPTSRMLSLIVEIRERDRRLGEVAIKIAPNDQISVNKAQFLRAAALVLRDDAHAQLRRLPGQAGFIALRKINAAGFSTGFDQSAMQLQFTPSPGQRPRGTIRLRRNRAQSRGAQQPPAAFSGYVNLRAATDYLSVSPFQSSGLAPPRADMEGVLRWEDVVLETEITYDGADTTAADRHSGSIAGYQGFSRRGSRIVHDRPEQTLRFQGGDINPPITGLHRGPDLLGVAVERSMRKLRPGENIRPTGARSFRIARPATVKIELNGIVVRQLRLDPGEYDLQDLPLQTGANDVRLIITDDLGEQRTLEFTSYFAGALLAEDIYEWGLAVGARSYFDGHALHYDYDHPIASGFYRRGFTPQMTGEAHLQAGPNASMTGAGLTAATPFGIFGVQAGASYHHTRGPGTALDIDWNALRDQTTQSRLRLAAELRSPDFATPGDNDTPEDHWLSLRASYSRPLPLELYANLSGRYGFATNRGDEADAFSVGLGISKSLSHGIGLGLSLDYSSDPLDTRLFNPDRDEFNDGELRVALRMSWRPTARTHVSAHYETASQTASVSATSRARQGTGSWTTQIKTIRDEPAREIQFDGGIFYSGHRATVSLDHTASLDATRTQSTLAPLTDQRTTVRVGTAIAFTDSHIAVAPPITGGFAIVAPHESLRDQTIVIGNRTRPTARSDALGPPVIHDLAAYLPRTVRYDVENLPVGYDLGNREFALRPDYKAGYALTVGSSHSVTAFGTLIDNEGEPVALVTGTAEPEAGDIEPVALFTNAAGRFGAQGLGPGRWYIAMATEPAQRFVLDIPPGTEGLYRVGTLRPVPSTEGS